ncbi:PA2778 family cysteine peptidase [Ramlibacter sp.]|uniref:PA2778 family cysteine peptidase n=1 Tax=Ramlibacter sp. TaxID=1917967 RepID=UPI0017D30F1E|nr:PA2778 family cysteine peptidase [Ramlibacter sp.]MBA2673022.1 PA2778 family cysteine peptidase [Ramlibacter sp.]
MPQTVALRTDWPQGVPERIELTRVPFFPQDDYQCGPAALATALAYSGVDVKPEALVDKVWLPARKGSLQLEMLAAPRGYGRVSMRLPLRYGELLREVAAGNPVVVLQDVGVLGKTWHYAVVNGFDYSTGSVFLRSGRQPRQEMSFTAFERSWLKGNYWAMVVTPPYRIPVTADEQRWMEAVVAFSRVADRDAVTKAYTAAVQRWPDSVPAAIGLANQMHARGALPDAASVLRRTLQRNPQSVVVMNNLAQTLSDQGRNTEAMAVIDKAGDPQSPYAADVRSTRQQIQQRMQQQKAGSR